MCTAADNERELVHIWRRCENLMLYATRLTWPLWNLYLGKKSLRSIKWGNTSNANRSVALDVCTITKVDFMMSACSLLSGRWQAGHSFRQTSRVTSLSHCGVRLQTPLENVRAGYRPSVRRSVVRIALHGRCTVSASRWNGFSEFQRKFLAVHRTQQTSRLYFKDGGRILVWNEIIRCNNPE